MKKIIITAVVCILISGLLFFLLRPSHTHSYTNGVCSCGDVEVVTYKVTFKDYDGSILKEQIVNLNSSATAPNDPTREGHVFRCWSEDFTNVTCDLIVIAKYESLHVHTYKIYDIDPTCLEQGYKEYKCFCGDSFKDSYVDALDHDIIIDEAVEPTCTESGLSEGKHCSRCDYKVAQEVVKELNHDIVIDEAVEPKCGKTGLTEGEHCTRCDYKVAQLEIPELQHKYEYDECVYCGEEIEYYTKGLAYQFDEENKGYLVTGIGTATDTDIIIPSYYAGHPVIGINRSAFHNNDTITSVVMPNTIIIIGKYSFSYCSNLSKVILSDSLLIIDDEAFAKTNIETIELPDTLQHIGSWAFYRCEYLKNITIPANVINIGAYAFANCSLLSETIIELGVVEIDEYAFWYCSSLKNITIPNTVTSIGINVFEKCTSLTNVKLPKYLSSISDYLFKNCSKLSSVTIPENVTSIGKYAFAYCTVLKEINLSDSIDSINEFAFTGCIFLKELTLPAGLKTLEPSAFTTCNRLSNIEIDNSNTIFKSVDGNLYSKDGKILVLYAIGKEESTFVIPDTVTEIGSYAFYNCTKLTSIVVPARIELINEYAFSECNNLTVYCEAASVPSGWNSKWKSGNVKVSWGYNA